MARQFLNANKIVKVANLAASSTDQIVSDIVDSAGYRGVVFMTSVGTANATNTMLVQGNTVNTTTGMADLAGTKVTSGTTDEDLIICIHEPAFRYLQAVVDRGSATACGDIWAILYGSTGLLASNSVAGTQIAEQHTSPAAGTA